MNDKFAIIGYSGHSFVILDSASKIELNCTGYYDRNTKEMNPFDIDYLGLESNIFDEEPLDYYKRVISPYKGELEMW